MGLTVLKIQPEIRRNTDRLYDLDNQHTHVSRYLDFTSKQNNVNKIASLKEVLITSLGDVANKLKQNEYQLKHIDDTFDSVHKTVPIFDSRHMDKREKKKKELCTLKKKDSRTLVNGNEVQKGQIRFYEKNNYPNAKSSKLSARNRSKGNLDFRRME